MFAYRIYILMAGMLLASGCTMSHVQQLGYFVVGNMHQLQCQKAMADDCRQAQSYDEYQRERQEIRQ